ncbi:hypothetical protein GO308_01840 [Sphingomonas sp. SFZ2018-12]|uniref:hypothetical protein n=1 Tax=Sphingomonas sp. SFZ2018-12 TaxID=2683197 RepID=UPI001F101476|nr:hypothetical protein [Sphingomonas sp. SFZ2018-12]MCH4891850.1 hypothetical protein [Sphingomonas sp. SFZ2018-12]
MALEKIKLFERTRDRWPLNVHIRPKDGVPCFEANPCLVDVYRNIEADCEPTEDWTPEDEWTNLANWAFHQALCLIAESSEEGQLRRDQVTFEMFDKCMKENLWGDDCWIAERVEYEASP